MKLSIFLKYFARITQKSMSLLPPVGVQGMKVLDREKFLRNIQVPILKVSETNLSKVIQHCKPFFLKLENFKPVQNIEDDEFQKCLYLNPEKVRQWSDITGATGDKLIQNGCTENNFSVKEIQLNYENWSFDMIFKAVLSKDEETVSGFSQIGHIIHVNLRDHVLEYQELIGQVLLDKIKTCRTVVNKSNIIDNTYRNFSMKVIAGEEDFMVNVKENNCNFKFDFSKVYWNPRLGEEHARILSFLKPDDVLFDVFCGVGPFSIPAAKRKTYVFANDLNPESYKWLNHNADKNKVNKSFFKPFNLDGKDFICNVFSNYLVNICKGNEIVNGKIHITMNLPAMAVEFLKYFKGLIKDEELKGKLDCEIIVYVYCFVVGEDPESLAKQLVHKYFGCDITPLDVWNVRKVSPTKEMMRVTFKLTNDIIFDGDTFKDYDKGPPQKKVCVDS